MQATEEKSIWCLDAMDCHGEGSCDWLHLCPQHSLKKACYVAHVLQDIFGHFGYPFVFHTDNGKEFTGQAILQTLSEMNPNILTITGRPRKPNDHGSVESMNKLVKQVINSILAEHRIHGENPNWMEILGNVASSINLQCGRGKYNIPAYTAVFGCTYNQDDSTTKEEARQCWTLTKRLKVRLTLYLIACIMKSYDISYVTQHTIIAFERRRIQ